MRLTNFIIAIDKATNDNSTSSSVSSDNVVGTTTHDSKLVGQIFGKITLKNLKTGDGSADSSLAAYNIMFPMNNAILNISEAFHVTGSLSANNDMSYSEAKRVYGDILIVSEGMYEG